MEAEEDLAMSDSTASANATARTPARRLLPATCVHRSAATQVAMREKHFGIWQRHHLARVRRARARASGLGLVALGFAAAATCASVLADN